ncbi:MAG: (d)CMP kinase [Proteobacteria bacterium]|nr:(d)CMP kinase [Pseudomonadota bacterium]
MKKSLVIAIDGPSASGKGTLAKKIAQHFDLPYLNTGALYRLVAFRAIEQKIDTNNFENKISDLVKNISEADLENEELFSEKVGAVASIIAKNPKLRAALFDFQKNFVAEGKKQKNGAVLDGRDTTTVICPDADFKFYITADVEIRAQRRFAQLQTSLAEILAQLKRRDENDLNRLDAPLKIAAQSYVIDNGNLSIEEGFQKMLKIIST